MRIQLLFLVAVILMRYILNVCNLITETNVNKIMLFKLQMHVKIWSKMHFKIMFCTSV